MSMKVEVTAHTKVRDRAVIGLGKDVACAAGHCMLSRPFVLLQRYSYSRVGLASAVCISPEAIDPEVRPVPNPN